MPGNDIYLWRYQCSILRSLWFYLCHAKRVDIHTIHIPGSARHNYWQMCERFTDLQSYFQELSPKGVLAQASPIEVSQHDNGIYHSSDKRLVGIAKANEMLIWGKKKEAQELLDCGFLKFAFFKSVLPCFTRYDLAVKSSRNSRWINSTRKFGIFWDLSLRVLIPRLCWPRKDLSRQGWTTAMVLIPLIFVKVMVSIRLPWVQIIIIFLQLRRRDLQAEFRSLNSQESPKRRSGTNSDNCANRKQKSKEYIWWQMVADINHGRVLYYGRLLTPWWCNTMAPQFHGAVWTPEQTCVIVCVRY